LQRDVDDVYKKKKSFNAMEQLKNTQKKPHFVIEMEKEHERLAQNQKKYNDIKFQIAEKQRTLENLKKKDSELVLLIPDHTELEAAIKAKEEEIKNLEEKLTWDEYTCECLTEARKSRKVY
jgi:hypothetical protein